ncbi:1-deoxy-D-xylulose-5-phosphate reductoisomerase [Ferrimicrobium acidiphilum]|jgi:1-deoxy-D-xylulose-5-phosphate reductoisomerase|uniref:1-deoxy-D-xylulose-5-phosphate reductoisomerase n=1 Tax=Ferrimicrobium acidiphilum TaxID=121039 RepID=UPI0023F11973|nr:1-deoxy-D-xylulose-5-phosphate reductoisomerase [Ferrimicrobium acidiphilum]MCL5054065.1 1-deoxy-D-xylulose-5-phosphate reductoisomerase [Gammaproteobacteria bacterium]
MKSLAVMGSTGSIGRQTLDLVRQDPDRFRVAVLGAHSDVDGILDQAREFRPAVVGLDDEAAAKELRSLLDSGIEVVTGDELLDALTAAEIVINGVTGFAGIRVTERALLAGLRLGLANKESLIAAGELVLSLLGRGGELIPVDSEHSAIFQLLGRSRDRLPGLARLVITASGGPFREVDAESLKTVTVQDALAHPTWSMGPKISVDSSTLFNKGLEVIEAHYLFGVDYEQIAVVVHPESLVHSMVEFTDGTTLAQLSMPDMRLPISLALYHPDRSPLAHGSMSWAGSRTLTFEDVDLVRFPGLGLAFAAGRDGGGAPCWMNAANEVAVEAFLAGRIGWSQIYDTVASAMAGYEACTPMSIDEVVELDQRARSTATDLVKVYANA